LVALAACTTSNGDPRKLTKAGTLNATAGGDGGRGAETGRPVIAAAGLADCVGVDGDPLITGDGASVTAAAAVFAAACGLLGAAIGPAVCADEELSSTNGSPAGGVKVFSAREGESAVVPPLAAGLAGELVVEVAALEAGELSTTCVVATAALVRVTAAVGDEPDPSKLKGVWPPIPNNDPGALRASSSSSVGRIVGLGGARRPETTAARRAPAKRKRKPRVVQMDISFVICGSPHAVQ